MKKIFDNSILLEAMLETDKQYLANTDDAVVKSQLNDILDTISEIPSEIDTRVTLDSVRIFSFRNEKFYIEMNELIRVQEEENAGNVVDALHKVIEYYSTKVDISLNNTFVIIRSVDIDKISETPEIQKEAVAYIKMLTDSGVNIVKK